MAKTILITGSSTGIGLASALHFHKQGWNVFATMRSPQNDVQLKALNSERILVLCLDLQDPATIEPAVAAGLEKFGDIDVLLNNAGYGQMGLFEHVSDEKIRAQFDVNFFGLMTLTRTILPHFRNKKSGMIINISAGAGLSGLPLASPYVASKFALEGFSESLSYELSALGISVKIVIPTSMVDDTSFAQRTLSDAPVQLEKYPGYEEFIRTTMKRYAEMSTSEGEKVDAAGVAEVVYEAATDGTDKFRYFVGSDEHVKDRYEPGSDEEYMNRMRRQFS